MANEAELKARCAGKCELCAAEVELSSYAVPSSEGRGESDIMLCSICLEQLGLRVDGMNVSHWRCLGDSMWSTVPAVQIMAWRLLKRLSAESWASDLLDMLYLDDSMLEWAESGVVEDSSIVGPTKDSNGAILQAGDSIVIIKDLNVKGTSFVAKRGTAVRNISLTDNPEHIEGRVNGTRIVILTCFVKKS
jgi:protein PhnA